MSANTHVNFEMLRDKEQLSKFDQEWVVFIPHTTIHDDDYSSDDTKSIVSDNERVVSPQDLDIIKAVHKIGSNSEVKNLYNRVACYIDSDTRLLRVLVHPEVNPVFFVTKLNKELSKSNMEASFNLNPLNPAKPAETLKTVADWHAAAAHARTSKRP